MVRSNHQCSTPQEMLALQLGFTGMDGGTIYILRTTVLLTQAAIFRHCHASGGSLAAQDSQPNTIASSVATIYIKGVAIY
ncbi:MAG: hypothetical protein SWN10_02410 [Pseudomonadota bacterium]|nr:hypothetical protein [Alteromonas alba]MDY6925931.1 hypothetical protein [Pseudomonadota bacterium]|tara:strand:+ start:5551 stop:5790 length:240 start_codon:yes stop_codon:yes gene_type:complete